MKKFYLLLFMVAVMFLRQQFSFAQADAGFTVDSDTGCTPFTVNFTNTSTGMPVGAWFYWQWGDGWNFTGFDTAHTYMWTGIMTVTLSAYDSLDNLLDTYQSNIVALNGHNGNFSVSKNPACPGEQIDFNPNGNNFYEWDFGDGFTSWSGWDSHTYSLTGNYSVMCIVNTDCGLDTIVKTVTVSNSVIPDAGINFFPNPVCPLTDVSFNPQDWSGSHRWVFSDGMDTVATGIMRTFPVAGDYTVSHILTNICGNSDTDTVIANVVDTIWPNPFFNFGPNPSCTNRNVNFSPNQWNGMHNWNVSDGYSTSTSSFNHAFSDTGIYEVIHTIINGCNNQRKDTQYVSIVDTMLCVSFIASEDTGCNPFFVSFTNTSANYPPGSYFVWNFDDGTPYDTAFNATHTFYTSGWRWVNLNLYDSINANIGNANIQIIVNWGHNGNFNVSQNPACPGESISFDPDGNNFIQWNFGDSTTSNNGWESHSYSDTGDYIVMCIVSTSCGADTIIEIVTISNNTSPNAQFNFGPVPACPNTIINFNPQVWSGTHNWWFSDGLDTNTNSYSRDFDTIGNYTVIHTITDACGGTNSDTEIVSIVDTIYSNPNFSFFPNFTCPGSNVSFWPNEWNGTHNWNFSDGFNSNWSSPSHSFSDTGIYSIIHTITNSCNNQNSDTQFISIVDTILCVSFIVSEDTGCTPFSVSFTNTSTNYPPGSYFVWNFDDGTPYDTSLNAYHTYYNSGWRWVNLNLYDSLGMNLGNTTKQLVVNPGHNGNFNISKPIACPGESLSFDPNGNNFVQWNFGDSVTSNNSWENHSYSDTGIYTVMCIVSTPCGTDTIFKNVTITNNTTPNAQINFGPVPACPNTIISFTPQEWGGTHNWWFSDGLDTNTVSYSKGFDTIGNYTVIHTITDACGGTNSDTVIVNIVDTIYPNPLFSYFPTTACPGADIGFWPNQWNGNHTWNFSDGYSATGSSISHSFSDTGNYTAIHIITNGCNKQSSDTQIVPIVDTLVCVSFIASEDTGCTPLFVSLTNTTSNPPSGSYFIWSFGDGSPDDTSFHSAHTFTNSSWFWVNLWLYDSLGFYLGGAIKQIVVNWGHNGSFNISKTAACPGEEINFNPNGNSFVQWDFGDGYISNEWWTTHTYSDTGVFTAMCIVNTSCGWDTISQLVTISFGALPQVAIVYNQGTVCPDDAVYFSTAGNYESYLWDFGDASSSAIPSPEHAYSSTGLFQVTLTVTNTCGNTNSDTTQIDVQNNVPANASFNYWNNPTCPYTIVNFTANASGNMSWTFGDGNSGTGREIGHFYESPGFYTVQLTNDNGCGNSASDMVSINVQYDSNNKPDANFSFDGFWDQDTIAICTGEEVRFRNESWGGDKLDFLWLFGDGDSAFIRNPSHFYTANGTMEVQLIIENGCTGKDTATKWVIVSPSNPPDAELLVLPPFPYSCPGDKYYWFMDDNLKGEEGFTYSYSIWFGDGDSAVNITQSVFPESPFIDTHSYKMTGTYIYQFIATNICGVSDTLTDTVNVTDPNPAPMFFADHFENGGGNDTTFCMGDTIGFMAIGGSSYLWQFPDGTTDSNSITRHVFDSIGTFTVQCIITNGCGETDTVNDVIIVGNTHVPEPWWDLQDNFICGSDTVYFNDGGYEPGGQLLTYLWDFGDGTASTLKNPYHVYSGGGVYEITRTVTNSCGSSSQSNRLMVDVPVVDFTGLDLQYCVDASPAILNGNPFGGTYSGPGIGGFTFTPSLAGTGAQDITYIYTNSQGCSGSVTKTTVVTPLPPADAGFDVNICTGDSALLNASGGVSYSWSPSSGLSAINIPDPKASPDSVMQYFVEVTDTLGCIAFDSVVVATVPSLTADAGADTNVCAGSSVQLNGTGGGTYQWYPSTGLNNADIPNPDASPVVNTIYHLIVVSGLCSDTDSVSVIVYPLPAVTVDSLSDVVCFGGNDGSIFITLSGNGPFAFNWSNGSVTEDIISLSQGNYSVTVTDTNLCTITDSAIIYQPTALSVSETHQDIICNGGSNGSIGLSLAGGTPPYAHNWGGGITTEDRIALIAGTYSDTIADSNFCVTTVNVNITQPPALVLTETHTDISCNGGNNGAVNLTVTGGTGSYSYLWNTGATTQDISGVNAGTYTVSVADANSCTSVLSVLLTEPSALAIAETHTNISCNGGSNGVIDVTASGGTPAYSYSWGDGPATEDRANLAAATYTLTVTDSKGCTAAVSIGITQPSFLALTINKNDNACNSQCNGDATVFPSGGTLPYSYVWSNSETSNSASGLCSGYVYLTVTDVNGCTVADSASITEPSPLTASVTSTDVTCNNGFDGTAAVAVSGGSGTILYQWSGGETTSSVTGLYSWVYTVNVIDFMCSDTIPLNVIINQPPALSMTPGSVNASCGNNDGTAWVDVSGGTPPYAYLWNDSLAQTNDTASALSAGQYTITVTDSVGCTAVQPVTVNNNGAPVITIDSVIKVSCSGGADGAIFISVSGTVPFTYLWSDSATSEDNSMLVKGVYQVTVADGSGCLAFGPPRTVGEPRPLDTRMAASAVLCNGDGSGWAAVTASGGTPPFTYQWSDPLAQTSDTAFGLSADTFSVTVSDVKGCTLADDTIVSEPLALVGAVTTTGVSCYGDSNGFAGISISGGTPPYVYLWNTGDSLPAVSNLAPAVYSITVSDSNGCTLVSPASVVEPAMLAVAFNITGASCNGVCDGVAGANVNGGTPPYTYLWSNSAMAANIMGLCTGDYYLTVTDNNGCSLNDSITVTEPLLLTLSIAGANASCNGGNDGTAAASPTGGTPPYQYQWSSGSTQPAVSGLQAGIYYVTVTDTNLCSINDSVSIGEPLSLTATVTGTDVSCNGGNDGTATVAAAGGSGNYQFTWTTGDSVSTVGNLAFGSYDVTIVDISCGDTAIANININEPSSITVALGSADAGCGNSDGIAWAIPSGGTAPFGIYGYLWDDLSSQVTDTATGLAAGSYSVTVDDDNGCTATGFVSVLNTGAPAVTVDSTTDAACFGNNNGAIYLSVSGAGQMTFNWSNGATDEDISGLNAGTYDVTVTDSAGCVNFASAIITEPTILTLTAASTDVSCNGICDGTAIANAIGSTPPYSYLWDDMAAQTTATPAGLCAGTFNVTVTDANGCTVTVTTVVNEPAGMSLSFTTTPVLCFGDSTGSIDLTVSGATGGYIFIWSNGAITEDISGLNGNTYYVTVTDSTGCSATDTLLLTEPAVLSVVLTSMNESCNGLCDGYSSASGGGGTSPYFYAWSNAETATLVTGLCPGTYYVTITDTNGCTANDSTIITEPAALTVIASATDITCNGLCDGSVNVVASGGTNPYTGDGINTGLCGGVYNYTVTDANGCTATNSASIVEPPALVIDTMTMTVASCPDTSCKDGSATVVAIGGTGTLTYLWNNGGNTGTISNLNSDTFYVTVTDGNGCSTTGSVFVDFLVGGVNRIPDTVPIAIGNQLLVYPNPNTGKFKVVVQSANSKLQNANLTIENILGEMVFQSVITNQQSAISLDLPGGVYSLKVEADGEVISVTRMVVVK